MTNRTCAFPHLIGYSGRGDSTRGASVPSQPSSSQLLVNGKFSERGGAKMTGTFRASGPSHLFILVLLATPIWDAPKTMLPACLPCTFSKSPFHEIITFIRKMKICLLIVTFLNFSNTIQIEFINVVRVPLVIRGRSLGVQTWMDGCGVIYHI